MSQLNQQLIDQLYKTPEEIAKLDQTEQKIGDIINWCCHNYQNSDKEQTYDKTKEYLAAVLTNVVFFIDSSSRELETLIELETQEVNRIGAELTIIYDRLKSARSVTGRGELSKMHAVKPTSRTGLKRRVIELSNSNFKNNIASINDLENISTLTYQSSSNSNSRTDFTTARSAGSSAGLMNSPVSLEISQDDSSAGYLERQSSFSSTSTQQSFGRPPPPPVKSSPPPPPNNTSASRPPPPPTRRF